jgi:hypothetical protein
VSRAGNMAPKRGRPNGAPHYPNLLGCNCFSNITRDSRLVLLVEFPPCLILCTVWRIYDERRGEVQRLLVPKLDAHKAQIAEVRGVQSQMSERLREPASQILAQRREASEAMARMESRLDARMDRIENRMTRIEDEIQRQSDKLDQIIMLLVSQNRLAGD